MSAAFFMRTMTETRRHAVSTLVATKFLPFSDLAGAQRHSTSFHVLPLVYVMRLGREPICHEVFSAAYQAAAF